MYTRTINDDAFTGLEAAIVLIAFVVVAAVFSYVILGAGFFTTQKSHEVVYAGVGSAASNIVVKGDVYGIANNTSENISYIQFDLGLAAGGYPVDVSKLNIIYSDTSLTPRHLNGSPVYAPDTVPVAGNWSIVHKSGSGITNPETDHIIRVGQTYTIRLNVTENGIPPRESLHIEIKPEIGASVAVSRTVPPSLTVTTLLT